ncbi:MAG: hypothetical protein PHH30_00995 [Bacteroidales bacterium]|nr:hypothetical protein [Bacteroidales bacterium]
MNKEERKKRYNEFLNNSMNNPNIISGVHNYCDRWCERCKFIKRCRVGLMELERLDDDDEDGSAIWEELSAVFEATIEMITEKAKEMGIDLNNIPELEKKKRKFSEIEKESEKYSTEVHNWIKNNHENFQQQTLEIVKKELAIPDFKEALEVIQWYEFFIHVKIRRASDGLYDTEEDDNEFRKNDSDGTAKIAIIAINRSIEAFTVLYQRFPEHEDKILGFLKQLSSIKQKMLATFPDAMAFKRSGFDE